MPWRVMHFHALRQQLTSVSALLKLSFCDKLFAVRPNGRPYMRELERDLLGTSSEMFSGETRFW